ARLSRRGVPAQPSHALLDRLVDLTERGGDLVILGSIRGRERSQQWVDAAFRFTIPLELTLAEQQAAHACRGHRQAIGILRLIAVVIPAPGGRLHREVPACGPVPDRRGNVNARVHTLPESEQGILRNRAVAAASLD